MSALPLLAALLGCAARAIAQISCEHCYQPNGRSQCISMSDATEACWACAANQVPVCSGDLCAGHRCSAYFNLIQGPFYLKNSWLKGCMDVRANGSVYLNTCENGFLHWPTNQTWYLATGHRLVNARSMLCINVDNVTGHSGQHLVLGRCTYQDGSKMWNWGNWPGSGFVQNKYFSDRCIDVWGDPGKTGAFIHLSGCEWDLGNTDQKWETMEPSAFSLQLSRRAAARMVWPGSTAAVCCLACLVCAASRARKDPEPHGREVDEHLLRGHRH